MRNPSRRCFVFGFNPFSGSRRKRRPARPSLAAETLEDRTLLTAYVVTTPNDTVAVDGLLSLREAIQAANTNAVAGDAAAGTVDGDSITFAAALSGTTITLAMGEYSISEDLVISGIGRGITIDANDLSRIFNVATDERVVIAGLTLTDGNVADSGGAISSAGGGLTRLDTLTITSSVAAGAGGGAVFSQSSEVVIVNSTISGNAATGASGAGGGVFNGPTSNLTVFNSTISGNTAVRAGGAIEDMSGAGFGVIISGSHLTNNSATGATGDGGALHVTGAADVSVTGGTITGNEAARSGGALYNGTGKMTISGTLIDNNTASGAAATNGGGAIYKSAGVLNIGGQAVLSNNTANGALGRGGAIYSNGGGTTINSVTFRDNKANGAGGGIELVRGVMNFTLSSLFRNLAGLTPTAATGDGGGVHVSGPGTAIMRLSEIRENVAAVDGGGLWGNAASNIRVLASIVTVNVANGDAATDGGGGIFNSGGLVSIINSTVTENRADGTAGSGGGVFSTAGTVLVNRSTIARNTANRAGGGFEFITGNADIDHSYLNNNTAGVGAAANPGNGGAIHISGTGAKVVVRRSDVINNTASNSGGGMWNAAGSTLNVFFCVVGSNVAEGTTAAAGGGGIFNDGGTISVVQSTISENLAAPTLGSLTGGGGVFSNGGTVSINSTLISRNVAGKAGGGVRVTGGTLVIDASTVVDNIAGQPPVGATFAGQGGGLSITGQGTKATVSSTSIIGNSAGIDESSGGTGGGIFVEAGSTANITGSVFTGNVATSGGGIFNSGAFLDLLESDLLTNRAANGGAIYNAIGGPATVRNSNVALNVAQVNGGGIYNESALTLSEGTTVFRNTAGNTGGGLFTAASGTSDVDLTLIFDNSPNNVAGPGAVI